MSPLLALLDFRKGPISVFVVVTMAANPMSQDAAFRILWNIKMLSLPGLSVHLLRVGATRERSYSAYLNLARLFSSTSRVMLLPGDLANLPDTSEETIVSQTRDIASTYLPSESFSKNSVVPAFAILPKDSSIWCSERFTYENSPFSDWVSCLQQLRSSGQVVPLDISISMVHSILFGPADNYFLFNITGFVMVNVLI